MRVPGIQPASSAVPLSWVHGVPGVPYFVTDAGQAWTPIGHNEALTWPHLRGLGANPEKVAAHFALLRAHGVTCLRLMLEYAARDGRPFERTLGRVSSAIVRTWDQLFALGEKHEIRFKLTPFDTFWMWKRWAHHAYNARNGGPCATPRTLLISAAAREAIKARLAFASDRWGGSGVVFAWDLWNEIHPAYAGDDPGHFAGFIADVADFVRRREQARYGRSHLITVSAFGPMLTEGFHSKELGATTPDPRATAAVFRHAALDFATVHTYARGTIDDPKNTVDPALAMGRLTRVALAEVGDARPYFDSEHGPIHTFKDKRRTLPEPFDEEYFRHLQWAHLASGGAGGGMRWPNRHPHTLTTGMHRAQASLAGFLPLIEWAQFRRRNLNEEIEVSSSRLAAFGCGDDRQAVVWLVRRGPYGADKRLARDLEPVANRVRVPGLDPGQYQLTWWHTEMGVTIMQTTASVLSAGEGLSFEIELDRDVAVAIRRFDT